MTTRSTSAECPYSSPGDDLEQGDIFRLDVIAPLCSVEKYIFRSTDGRHGISVFDEKSNLQGKVFHEDELNTLLENTRPRDQFHTKPFQKCPNGNPELVITHAYLQKHFIIATQTCDICGKDRQALPDAIILPIKTIAQIFRSELLPINNQSITLEAYLEEQVETTTLQISDEISYQDKISEVVRAWNPNDNEKRRIRNKITKLISNSSKWLFYLAPHHGLQIPPSYVDCSSTFTISRDTLLKHKDQRLASIRSPYREHFSRHFGDRFGRVALDNPMTPPTF